MLPCHAVAPLTKESIWPTFFGLSPSRTLGAEPQDEIAKFHLAKVPLELRKAPHRRLLAQTGTVPCYPGSSGDLLSRPLGKTQAACCSAASAF